MMKKEEYITDEEREKCRRVADAFAELYEQTDIIVLDAGEYGFVKLQYYMRPYSFDNLATYTDSQSLFDDLWDDWFDIHLLSLALGTPDMELDYDEILKRLPKGRQDELLSKKTYFKERASL